MPLRDFLEKKDLYQCTPDSTISEVAQLMKDSNVGAVLVTENNKPLGMVTDRDIVLRCVTVGTEFDETPVRDIMTTPVITVKEEGGIFDIIKKMKDTGCRRVAVVNAEGNAVDILSSGDVLELLVYELAEVVQVASSREEKLLRKTA